MASVLNRTTKQLLRSVNTPDYSPASWIVNPDLSSVEGWPTRYWQVSGDAVTLADEATRDAIDAALVSAARDQVADEFDRAETVWRAFAELLIDELNSRATAFNTLVSGIASAQNLNDAKSAATAAGTLPTRSLSQLKTALRGKLGA